MNQPYDRSKFDFAAWERETHKPYPYQHILWSVRRRPWYGRITGLGWFSIITFASAVAVLIWGGR